jgi:hypothetical protein
MRPKLQKHSALKLAGRIIPQSGGYNTPQLDLGYYTRDLTANEKTITQMERAITTVWRF